MPQAAPRSNPWGRSDSPILRSSRLIDILKQGYSHDE
jgi:hypothetical protein